MSFSKRLINSIHRASTFQSVENSFWQNFRLSLRKWNVLRNLGGGIVRILGEGCCAVCQSWPYFRPKNVIFTPVFRPGVLTIYMGNTCRRENISQIQQKSGEQLRKRVTNLEYKYRQIRTRMNSTGEEGAKKIMGTKFFHALAKSLDRGMELILLWWPSSQLQ